ncbi:ABC transporter substrate-binding protein [Halobium palmae]|uniref:ABC transporter substrate-binding protein n=1 Tax=Halobium palmae TaxID=1776492 RepID=A0ABD5RVC7_9EURY
MAEDDSGHEAPTRRDYVKYGGAVVGGGLLAGCSGGESGATSVGTSTESTTGAKTNTPEDESYSVTMSPVGTVEFESVPESAMVYSQLYADAAVALGHGGAVNSLGFSWYGDILDFFLDSLDIISPDWGSLPQIYNDGLDKEVLYELDSDVHLMDPTWALSSAFGWSRVDVDEIAENVGPWFGNYFSRLNGSPPDAYAGSYEYYTMWEIVEKVSQVFREEGRYDALATVRADLRNEIASKLPEERPSVALTMYSEEEFRVYFLNEPGYARSFTRPFGATDVFAEMGGLEENTGWLDFEGMLELDPDVILQFWGITPDTNMAEMRTALESHPVGKELTAVRNDRVYASGVGGQGPIMNLFQLEMTAKQLYPEQFGEWPGYVDGEPYPEIPDEERLFDRQRVADVVNGEFEQ